MSYSSGCNGWPFEPAEPVGDIVAEGSRPNHRHEPDFGSGDPAAFLTNWQNSWMTASHITVEGEGHGAYSPDNACIVEAI